MGKNQHHIMIFNIQLKICFANNISERFVVNSFDVEKYVYNFTLPFTTSSSSSNT